MKTLLYATILFFAMSIYVEGTDTRKPITKTHSPDTKPALSDAAKEAMAKARLRMDEDYKTYSRAEIDEIEALYQDAKDEINNRKTQKSLKKLVEKYKKANRTGCVLMMLAEASEGKKKELYFLQAAKDHPGCYYGDGVQVGAYALYRLAGYYLREGQKKKAEPLLKEMKEKYPDAIDHRGRLLSSEPE